MKICLNCKKIFEDDIDVCPECGAELKKVKNAKKKADDDTGKKVLVGCGWGCVGCLAIIGILFFILVMIGVISSFSVGNLSSEYKKQNRVSMSSNLMVKNNLMSARSRARQVARVSELNNFSTAEEVVEKAFLTTAGSNFTKTSLTFTNLDVCNGPTFVNSLEQMYCIKNWSNEYCDESNNEPCAFESSQPNLYVDINGLKGPNLLTENKNQVNDIFPFYIYNSAVKPTGVTAEIM